MLNSLSKHYKNCMTDSKENYKFDLGVKGLIHFGERMAKGKGSTRSWFLKLE